MISKIYLGDKFIGQVSGKLADKLYQKYQQSECDNSLFYAPKKQFIIKSQQGDIIIPINKKHKLFFFK